MPDTVIDRNDHRQIDAAMQIAKRTNLTLAEVLERGQFIRTWTEEHAAAAFSHHVGYVVLSWAGTQVKEDVRRDK